jgi:hypothetical protein
VLYGSPIIWWNNIKALFMSFENPLYTVSEIAEMTKLSEEKLLEHARVGFAPCLIVDGQYFFKKSIFSWIKKHFVKVQKGMTFPEKLTIYIEQPTSETTIDIPKELRKLEGLKKYDLWKRNCLYRSSPVFTKKAI